MVRLVRLLPLALSVTTVAAAQTNNPAGPPVAKSDYALTNVRIVAAPGRVIERGTVVFVGGRITAVGANVQIPAGVVRMDLAGHTVYPGLIDAATSTGLPLPNRPLATTADPAAAPAGRGGGGRGAGQPLGRGGPSTPPPVIFPEIEADAEAADMFQPTEAELKAIRAGGVTTVGLVFNGGIFPGRVGAALTGTRENSNLALRPGAAQQVAFGTKRNGEYPGTGIGSVAFIRQAYLDAQYEARVERAFKAGIPGARPTNEPFARALVPAATNAIPSWFVANNERQIVRAADIATEMELKNPVVVGTQEGWRAIPALKRMGATAVVSLMFPDLTQTTGRVFNTIGLGKSGTAPALTAADTNEVRGNAAALVKAGVPVALASFGGASGTTFRDNIRLAIAAGLSPDEALKATTVTPAALLGITSAVGTIEVGKLANVVVVSGNDLFAAGTPIKHVFVEGRIY
jgi:imidazolonepropionase-like amidohydrolase